MRVPWFLSAAMVVGWMLSAPNAAHAQGKPVEAKKGAAAMRPGLKNVKGKTAEKKGKLDPAAIEKKKDAVEKKAEAKKALKGKGKGKAKGKEARGDEGSAPAPGHLQLIEEAKKRRAERQEREKALRAQKRNEITQALKGRPMERAFTEELRRHAQSRAKLDRVEEVAAEKGDTKALQRVIELRGKEMARHKKWVELYESKAPAEAAQ